MKVISLKIERYGVSASTRGWIVIEAQSLLIVVRSRIVRHVAPKIFSMEVIHDGHLVKIMPNENEFGEIP